MGTIEDNYDHNVGGGWVPKLRRNLNEWEMTELTKLLGLLGDCKPKEGLEMGGCGLRIKRVCSLQIHYIEIWRRSI